MASAAHLALYARGLFHKSGSSSSSSTSSADTTTNHTCALPNPLTETPTDPIAGNYTFHTLGTIIAGAATGFAILSIFLLMFRHATHLSKPNEQLKILRICLLIPVNALFQFIGQAAPASYFYLTPWADLMQSLALGNFFLLLLEFISPHDNQRDLFFSGLQVPSKKSGNAPKDGLRWYRRKWIAIFQYPIVQFLVCIATDVTQSPSLNVYCQNSNKPYFAHLWLNIVHVLSLVTAVISCLRFYKTLKAELVGHKPLSKLFAFKLMVGINFLMTIIFLVLDGMNNSPLTPSNTMNQADVSVGIPAVVNCVIMVPFSIFFHYAYDVGPYIIDRHAESELGGGGHHSTHQYQKYQGGFLGIRAFTGMLNPGEILGAIAFVFRMGKKSKRSYSLDSEEGAAQGYAPAAGQAEQLDAGYAVEMNRRDQRRMDKYTRTQPAATYNNQRNDSGAYGYPNQQAGGYQSGQYQQGYSR